MNSPLCLSLSRTPRASCSLAVCLGLIGNLVLPPSSVAGVRQCNALVDIANDLFLISETGTTITRFTNDGVRKFFPALAPDGSKVAFGLEGTPQMFRIVTASGQQGTFPALEIVNRTAPITLVGLTWASNTVLGFDKHLGPNAGQFEFYRIATDPSASPQRIAPPAVGDICILLPNGKRVACLHSGHLLVNGRKQFSDIGFSDAIQVDSLTIPLGASASTITDPRFQIEVKSLSDGVLLRITPPEAVWSESIVNKNDLFVMSVKDEHFGFSPVQVNTTTGLVTVTVLKSRFGLRVFDQVLAGNRTTLALVRRLGSEATLMLIRGKKKLGEAALNIPEQLSSLRFLTETTLFFETQQRFGTFTVAPPQLGTSLLQLGPISELPRTLTVNLPNGPVSTNVLDWSCMIQ